MPATMPGPSPAGNGHPLSAGSHIGRYRIRKPIGRGGMGEVYLATDEVLGRPVALKRIALGFGDDRAARRRFLKEARHASLSDPRIAAVFDVFEEHGDCILVMEYVEGDSLRTRMDAGLTLEDFWSIALPCVEALGAAHRGGLVHRDIKPENIMVTPHGQVKLLDFGLSRRLPEFQHESSLSSASGAPAGTTRYMSPEACMGDDLDERADIFSLGVVFYEALTGVRPFNGATLFALVDRVLHHEPDPPHVVKEDVPRALSLIVARMLSRHPTDRHRSTRELMEHLVRVRSGRSVPAPSPKPVRRRFLWRAVFAAPLVLALFPGVRSAVSRVVAPPLPEIRNVAVLLPENDGAANDLDALGAGLMQIVARRLSMLTATPGLQVAPMDSVVANGYSDFKRAREDLGVNLALVPAFRETNGGIEVTLDLVDARNGRRFGRTRRTAPNTEPLALLDQLVSGATGLLHVVDDRAAPAGAGTDAQAALQFYARGLGRLARAADGSGLSASLTDFERSISADPTFTAPRVAEARAVLRLYGVDSAPERLKRAETECREALAIDAERAEAHLVLGHSLRFSDRLDEAERAYARAVALEPTCDEAIFWWSRTLRRLGRRDAEERVLLDAAARRPHNGRLQAWLGTLRWSRGDIDGASAHFEAWSRRCPDHYLVFANLGGLYIMEGRYGAAVEALETSLTLRPGYEAFSNLGAACFMLRRFEQAIDTYHRALHSGFADYGVWYNLGEAYHWNPDTRKDATGAYRQAAAAARRELQSRPEDPVVTADLADILARTGHPDSAGALITRALESAPGNPRVSYSAALVYWSLDQPETALDHMERAVYTGYPRIWLRDSPVFDPWREHDRFRRLLDGARTG